MKFRRKPRENVEINLASLIDVVFILLLFFVVTTTFTRETQLKVDLPEAASEDEIPYALGLTNATTGKGKATDRDSGIRPIEIYMCSVVRRMGFSEGFKWVAQYIK